MLTNAVAYLLFIGLCALLKFRVKADKFIVPLMTFATCFVFYLFCKDFQTGDEKITTLTVEAFQDALKSLESKIPLEEDTGETRALFKRIFRKK